MKRYQEQLEEINYPLGMQSITVGKVFRRLQLLRGRQLRQAVRDGKITVNGQPVRSSWQRVSTGQTIAWCEYRIHMKLEEDEKRRRLMQNQLMSVNRIIGVGNNMTNTGGGMARK